MAAVLTTKGKKDGKNPRVIKPAGEAQTADDGLLI